MKLLLSVIFISIPLLVASSHLSNDSRSEQYCPLPTECMLPEENHMMAQEHICCGNLTTAFECSWWNGRMQLTQYLNLLKSWNCSEQLELECKQRTFSFNDFTEKIYLSFCDRQELEETCLSAIVSANANITWEQATRSFDTSRLHKDKLQDSCVQIALYESNKTDFAEFVRIDFLTCSVIWCGFDSDTYRERDISMWSCAPSSCKVSVVIIAILLLMLAIVSLVINSLVIYVYRNTPSLHHGQSIYKTSIAASDVIIALFTMPSIVSNMFTQVHGRVELKVDAATNTAHAIAPLDFNRVYSNIFGFFFLAATLVSIYTMLFAAADRLFAVFRPLNYRRRDTKLLAFRVCVGIWISAAVFSLLPAFAEPFLFYGVLFGVLFTFTGSFSLIIYAVFLGLPIPTMWVLSIATFLVTRKHTRKTAHLTSSSNSGSRKSSTVETRLAKTLLFMVMAFTLSILPAVITLILGFSMPNINFTDPRSLDIAASSRVFSAEFFAFVVLICNTMWNFFIYNARNEQFKKAVRALRTDVLTKLGCSRLLMRYDVRTKSNASNHMSKRKTTVSGFSTTNDGPTTSTSNSGPVRELSSTAV